MKKFNVFVENVPYLIGSIRYINKKANSNLLTLMYKSCPSESNDTFTVYNVDAELKNDGFEFIGYIKNNNSDKNEVISYKEVNIPEKFYTENIGCKNSYIFMNITTNNLFHISEKEIEENTGFNKNLVKCYISYFKLFERCFKPMIVFHSNEMLQSNRKSNLRDALYFIAETIRTFGYRKPMINECTEKCTYHLATKFYKYHNGAYHGIVEKNIKNNLQDHNFDFTFSHVKNIVDKMFETYNNPIMKEDMINIRRFYSLADIYYSFKKEYESMKKEDMIKICIDCKRIFFDGKMYKKRRYKIVDKDNNIYYGFSDTPISTNVKTLECYLMYKIKKFNRVETIVHIEK